MYHLEMQFKINDHYTPRADQPAAISGLTEGIQKGYRLQTLLGATGTGKTFTIASVIAELQRPALVVAPNKTLAAQLVGEFRELFPENRVEYFVSYYDHYRPEAYLPGQDVFIEKDAAVNAEIDRLRHSATSSILSRRDTIVVASVSCIYGIGSPENYKTQSLLLQPGKTLERESTNRMLAKMQYRRNDTALEPGTFSWRGEIFEVWPAGSKRALRARLWGDEIESLEELENGQTVGDLSEWLLRPASHWTVEALESGIARIEKELASRLPELQGLPQERLRERVEYDIEMLRELGWTSGIENYSAPLEGRAPGEPPSTLLDYFPDDFLLFLDESHQTVPQIGAMYEGDRSRKQTLVDYGFRLPSALDNRPLRDKEFWERVGQTVCLSATPGEWEREQSLQIVEQIVRPTGILDPQISVRKKQGQIDDLLGEIRKRAPRERVLVTTLTKRQAEDLSEHLRGERVRVCYLHSDVPTLQRIEILRDLRSGRYDVLVGVNLLREGLDLPEVSLVAILDADREGFLRGETALIQTIGRAARHPDGTVLLYADKQSRAMQAAIQETDRRRQLQAAYNKKHEIRPEKIEKGPAASEDLLLQGDLQDTESLRRKMEEAARELRFEEAADLRDRIAELENQN